MRIVVTAETTIRPGDIGNYFPFSQGNTWNFQGTHTVAGQPTVNFQSTLKINRTHLVNGITTTVRSESNPDGSGTPVDDYVTEDTTGITNYGNNDPTDLITPQIVPYQEVQFPLQAGASFTVTKVAGTFSNAAQIKSVVTAVVTLSKTGSTITKVEIETMWVAPGVGPIKREDNVTQAPGGTATTSEELVSFVVSG